MWILYHWATREAKFPGVALRKHHTYRVAGSHGPVWMSSSRSMKFEIWNQGVGRVDFFWKSRLVVCSNISLWLGNGVLLPVSHLIFPLCMSVFKLPHFSTSTSYTGLLLLFIHRHEQHVWVSLVSSVMSDSLPPHELQHASLPCPSLSPGVCSNSCPLSWCNPNISSSVAPFLPCPRSFPASGSFPVGQPFQSIGQSIRASASVLPMNIQGWFPLRLTGLISCCPRDSQESPPTP